MDNFLKEAYNSILSDNRLRFIFKVALHSRNYRVKITNLLFKLNNIDTTLKELREDVFFNVFVEENNTYLNVLKKSDKSIKIELTESGVELAEALEYDKSELKKNTIPLKVKNATKYAILSILKIILYVLVFAIIGLLITPFYYEGLIEIFLYIFGLITTIFAVLSYYKD